MYFIYLSIIVIGNYLVSQFDEMFMSVTQKYYSYI